MAQKRNENVDNDDDDNDPISRVCVDKYALIGWTTFARSDRKIIFAFTPHGSDVRVGRRSCHRNRRALLAGWLAERRRM